MRLLNEQAQLFLVAALCFALALIVLYWALAVWIWCIDKACRILAIHGAIIAWSREKTNRKRWFIRFMDWTDRFLHPSHRS